MRFPHFSNEWTKVSIGSVSLPLEYGMNAAAKEYDGTHKYIRITDINDETNKYIGQPIVSPYAQLDDKYIVSEDDILFARTGASTGKTYLYDKADGLLYYAGFLIRAHIKPEYNSYFVFSQTLTSKYRNWVKLMSMRSGQPGINSQEFSGFSFYMPTLDEQVKISTFLTVIDQRIDTQSKIIEKLQSQMKAIIGSLIDFSAPQVKFEMLYNVASEGGTPATNNQAYYENGNIPFIKIDDLTEKYIVCHKEHISELGLKNSSAWLIPENSVIYSNGATVGRVAINTYPITTKQGILGIVPSENILTEYLYYLMKTTYFRREVCRITVKGTMECAYLKDLITITCYLPSIDKQKRTLKLLHSLDEQLELQKLLLHKLKEQKKYLLSNMFI